MEGNSTESPNTGEVKEVLAISSIVQSVEPPNKPVEEIKEMESKTIIDFFNRNYDKQKEEAFNPMGDDEDEDDMAIVKSKYEQEYAKRFIDYDD